jgi:AmmeMemoRadiSam system protein A
MLPLSEADQQFLLQLARRTLQEKIQAQSGPPLPKIPATLEKPSGAFVTLRQAGNLRGCIGRVEAVMPLHQTVRECTLSAALEDPRFDPVRPEEVPYLRIGISVLSSLQDSRPEEVEVGRHGLYISYGLRRGLLLPQVAVEWNWNRERFLEETCLKAGLPPDAWRHGSRIQTFTAQVFEEQEPIERALTRTG